MESADNKLTDGLWALLSETFECILLAEPDPWRVKYANRSAAERFEALPHELVGREIAAFFMEPSKKEVICQLDETLAGQRRRFGPSIALLQTPIPYNDVAYIKCVRLTLDGVALVGVLLDDTLSPQMDALTPLRDRNYLHSRLLQLFTHSAERFAILFIDLDGFKRVNDEHGHLIGDRVLYVIAERILFCTGLANPATRYGGDEFVVLVEDVDTGENVDALATRIRDAIAPPISVLGGEVVLSASIGIAISSPEYRTPVEMLTAADRAMYAAKRK
jgi:diguanylate cyclase (GGDEF)-like protein